MLEPIRVVYGNDGEIIMMLVDKLNILIDTINKLTHEVEDQKHQLEQAAYVKNIEDYND